MIINYIINLMNKLSEVIKNFPDYKESFYTQQKELTEEPYVLYVIVNKSLPMKSGKIASQVGHAIQKITEYCMVHEKKLWSYYCSNNYAKIVLKINDENKLLDILNDLKDVHKAYVVDEGRTQITPNSVTAIGFIPMLKKNAPECIKQLKLL